MWVKIKGAASALIRASLKSGKESYNCTGNVIAKSGCWSFLKGGFTLQSPSKLSVLYFQVHYALKIYVLFWVLGYNDVVDVRVNRKQIFLLLTSV